MDTKSCGSYPCFHVCEEILELREPDLGRGHELLHHGQVPVPGGQGLAPVELHLPSTFLHAVPQLSHVFLKFFHTEIVNSWTWCGLTIKDTLSKLDQRNLGYNTVKYFCTYLTLAASLMCGRSASRKRHSRN